MPFFLRNRFQHPTGGETSKQPCGYAVWLHNLTLLISQKRRSRQPVPTLTLPRRQKVSLRHTEDHRSPLPVPL
jgi:hypothetical protein